MRLPPPPPPFWVYAHRGASAEQPENTLAAFALALELGVDALETDVHLSRDGHVVVHHDTTGARTCKVDAALGDCTLADIRTWDAGDGQRVPSLAEVLDAFPATRLNVDIKTHTKAAVMRVIDTVNRANAASRVLLTSVDQRTINRVCRAGYTGPTGFGRVGALRVAVSPGLLLKAARPSGVALQIPHTIAGRSLGRPALIHRCHAVGIRVDYWTVNEPSLARQLVAAGADGIMTDDPRRLVPVIRAARAAKSARS